MAKKVLCIDGPEKNNILYVDSDRYFSVEVWATGSFKRNYHPIDPIEYRYNITKYDYQISKYVYNKVVFLRSGVIVFVDFESLIAHCEEIPEDYRPPRLEIKNVEVEARADFTKDFHTWFEEARIRHNMMRQEDQDFLERYIC